MSQHDHLVRVEMYKAARELLGPGSSNGYYPPSSALEVLEISGDNFRDLLPWKTYESRLDLDVCAVPGRFWHECYDLVVLDQVLEHVLHPSKALDHVRLTLRPGGRVFVATPFLIKVHPSPLDLWRWTPDGLAELLAGVGLTDVRTGSWGNKAAVVANFDGWAIRALDDDMTNDPAFPVTCWAVGTR